MEKSNKSGVASKGKGMQKKVEKSDNQGDDKTPMKESTGNKRNSRS